MKPTKLEAFYLETFGEAAPSRDPVAGAPARRDEPPRRRRERSGFGRRLLTRLGLMFAPMAILGLMATMTDCDVRSPNALLPDLVRKTVCARKTLPGQASALDGTFRTLSNTFR